jgi:hypothetical protein
MSDLQQNGCFTTALLAIIAPSEAHHDCACDAAYYYIVIIIILIEKWI